MNAPGAVQHTGLLAAAAPPKTRRWNPVGYLLGAETLLFALRVAAQANQRVAPVAWLPPFNAFQGSTLPYVLLLPAQLAILLAMLVTTRSFLNGWRPGRSAQRWLVVSGAIYLAVATTRLMVGFLSTTAPGWFHAWISGAFHVVLASYVLLVAASRYARRATDAAEGCAP